MPTPEESLLAATRTLNLSEETLPPPDTSAEDSIEHGEETHATGCETSLPHIPNIAAHEKKKRVSLADYRKRLQSRSSKPQSNSTSSEIDKSECISPKLRPVFEPISPGDPEKQSTLLEEFTRPSLSESMSDEQLNPSKMRRIDHSLSDCNKASSRRDNPAVSYSKSVNPHVLSNVDTNKTVFSNHNGGNHSPPLSEDTFSKIKEILSQSNAGLVSSGTLNVSSSIFKSNHPIYDPNAASVKQFKFPNQFSDDPYSRDPKRLKSTLGHSQDFSKYSKESDKR